MKREKLLSWLLLLSVVAVMPWSAHASKEKSDKVLDTVTIEKLITQQLSQHDAYDPLVQQHFAFDPAQKVFAVINGVENRIEIIHLEGDSLVNINNNILVDNYEGRHDLVMVYRPQGVAIYEKNIVYLASNRDSCYLCVLDLMGNQLVKKYYKGSAQAFSYSKSNNELYIAGEFDLGYNLIIIDTKGGLEHANYDTAPFYYYKKPRKAEAILEHDPYGIGLTVVAMGVVFLTLLMLSIVFMVYGKSLISFQTRRARKLADKGHPVSTTSVADISGEENAAIAAAIYLYNNELHDYENTVLTIQNISRHYSPWSAKSQVMNKYFRNRK